MTEPVCPDGYTCTFDKVYPPEPGWTGPWWETGWGIAAAAVAIVALVVIVFILADAWNSNRKDKREAQDAKERRQHELDLEEQRTLQLDAAQGNPEMLKLVRERVR